MACASSSRSRGSRRISCGPSCKGGASVVPEAAVGKRKAPAEEQQDWELKVTVEGEQLDRVWRGLSDEEKATAIQAVLQAQVDALLAIQ